MANDGRRFQASSLQYKLYKVSVYILQSFRRFARAVQEKEGSWRQTMANDGRRFQSSSLQYKLSKVSVYILQSFRRFARAVQELEIS